jgi:putative spermidine/putrescine transport system ATP-binding protein
MSDRVAVVNGGRIVQLDTPRVLYEQPANRFVAEFIGESSLLPVQRDGDAWHCAGQPIAHAGAAPASTRACLMLRPERVRLLGADGGEGLNVLPAQVSGIVYQGDSFLLQARLAGGHAISLRGMAGAAVLDSLPASGDLVRLGFAPTDTVLLADEG